jgi:hypothetical protein
MQTTEVSFYRSSVELLSNFEPQKLEPDNNGLYHLFYKTTNLINNKYYFGVHSTNNPDDEYMGSGKLLLDAISKYGLNNFIKINLRSFNSKDEMYEYEKNILNPNLVQYIMDNRLGYNLYIGGSGGWYIGNKSVAQIRVDRNTHNWQKRSDGSSHSSDMVKNGVHPFITRSNGTNIQTDRVKQGIHQYLKRPDGTSHSSDMVKNGIHPFLTRSDGTNIQTDRVKDGTHNWLYIKPWNHTQATQESLRAWYLAEEINRLRLLGLGYRRIEEKLGGGTNANSVCSVCNYLEFNWIPKNDKEWVIWKDKYEKSGEPNKFILESAGECEIIDAFSRNSIKWEYEPRFFYYNKKGSSGNRYRPQFYLPDFNIYVSVHLGRSPDEFKSRTDSVPRLIVMYTKEDLIKFISNLDNYENAIYLAA